MHSRTDTAGNDGGDPRTGRARRRVTTPATAAALGLAVAAAAGPLAAGAEASQGAQEAAAVTAFVDARVIVGDGSDPIEGATFVVEGDRVAEDLGWLSGTIPADELAEIQARFVDRPDAQAGFAVQARNLARLNAEGMRIAFGTDGNAGWSPHVEMADMVASGMTPHEVIVAATSTSAAFLGLEDAGTVAPGRSADFVVLGANPLDDIVNTRRIEAVYLRGAAVDRDALSESWVGGP